MDITLKTRPSLARPGKEHSVSVMIHQPSNSHIILAFSCGYGCIKGYKYYPLPLAPNMNILVTTSDTAIADNLGLSIVSGTTSTTNSLPKTTDSNGAQQKL